MKVPSSFCTICTNACGRELIGFLLTLSLHHRDADVFVACDSETKSYIEQSSPQPKLKIHWGVTLDKYSNKGRFQMEQEGIWSEFQMEKSHVIARALESSDDTMFLDCDTFILDTLLVDESKQLGVSPQFINDEEIEKTGYYNGGLLWTNQKDLPEKWRTFTEHSRYYDQASIEDLAKVYDTFEFDETYNVHTWRFRVGKEDIKPYFSSGQGKLLYKNEPVKFLHTHFNRKDHEEQNQLFTQKMTEAGMWRELAIVFRINQGYWCLVVPQQPKSQPFDHINDSFRELVPMLAKKNPDVAMAVSDSNHCWLLPSVLLYDRPTLYWADNGARSALMTLLGNGDVNVEGKAFVNGVKPWIFWPRRPSVLEEHIERLPWHERMTESIFIGNFETDVQEKFRTGIDWIDAVTEYHCTAGAHHKFTQDEYLDMLKHSKFGLCLRGFGSKCHREVELMAMGTVPLVTEHVSIDSYYDPPVEDVHYIRVDSPEDAKKKVGEITKEKWEEMSKACHQWYLDNVHSDNAWQRMIHYLVYDSLS